MTVVKHNARPNNQFQESHVFIKTHPRVILGGKDEIEGGNVDKDETKGGNVDR